MTDAEDVMSVSLSYRHRGGMIKQKTTVDQGHLELGTYSNERFNLKTYRHTHTRYFSINLLQHTLTHLHLTQKWCNLRAPWYSFVFTALCSPRIYRREVCAHTCSEGKMHTNVFLCLWMCKRVCVCISESSYKNDTQTHMHHWHSISRTDYISHVCLFVCLFVFYNKSIQDLQTNEIRCQKTSKTLRWHKTPVQEHRSDLR